MSAEQALAVFDLGKTNAKLLGFGDQLGEDALQLFGLVGGELESAVTVKLGGAGDRQFPLDHAPAEGAEDFARLGLGPDRAEHPGRGADHRRRLAGQGALEIWNLKSQIKRLLLEKCVIFSSIAQINILNVINYNHQYYTMGKFEKL